MCVEADDTGLIWLSDVGEDAINHADEHAVFEWVTGVLNNGDDVGAVRSHVDQIATGTVGELDGEDSASWANDVGDMRDRGARCRTQVKHLAAGLHVNVLQSTQDTSGQLGTERIPYAVFGLGSGGSIAIGRIASDLARSIDGNALLAVDSLAGGQVLGDE